MSERSPHDKGARIPGPLVTGGVETEGRGAPRGSELAQVQGSTPKGSSRQQELGLWDGAGVSSEFPAEAEPGSGSLGSEPRTLGPYASAGSEYHAGLGASMGGPGRGEVVTLPVCPSEGPLRTLSRISNPKGRRMPQKGPHGKVGREAAVMRRK